MDVSVADHPLVAHKLTYLRDERTDSPTFRRLADELVTLLAYEATREVRVEPFAITTPVTATTGIKLAKPKPIIVPILRAGLGMLEGMTRLLPSAEVGFLGMIRNEETLEVSTYANRLPDDLTGLRFRLRYRQHAGLEVAVTHDQLAIGGGRPGLAPLRFRVHGSEYDVDPAGTRVVPLVRPRS